LRQQLRPQRLDPIAQVGEALFDPAQTLLILGESSIDALEAFEHLSAHLLQPDIMMAARVCELRAAQLSAISSQLSAKKHLSPVVRFGSEGLVDS
jgi:hypothetical protein